MKKKSKNNIINYQNIPCLVLREINEYNGKKLELPHHEVLCNNKKILLYIDAKNQKFELIHTPFENDRLDLYNTYLSEKPNKNTNKDITAYSTLVSYWTNCDADRVVLKNMCYEKFMIKMKKLEIAYRICAVIWIIYIIFNLININGLFGSI